MNFSFLSKQNCGVALFLLFVIIISESPIIDFFFNNSLGRAIFILLILIIAYTNNILGVVSVLLAILFLQKKENKWLEGFENTQNSDSSIKNQSTTEIPSTTNTTEPPSTTTTMETPSTTTIMESPSNTTTTNAPSITTDPSGNTMNSTVNTKINNMKKMLNSSENEAIEGFDILGTENNLKRGKKSNSIPVSNQIRKSEYVDPYYQSSFGNSYQLY